MAPSRKEDNNNNNNNNNSTKKLKNKNKQFLHNPGGSWKCSVAGANK
jgi:hypothetical protein